MGNVVGINCNIPLDQIGSFCWRQTCSTTQTFPYLQKDWERLEAARSDVLIKIELEERQHHRRLATVDEWLQKVEAVEIEFDKLRIDYVQQFANKCFCGYCPKNFKTSYVFRKKVASVREDLVSLLERIPDKVAQNSLIRPPAERPVDPTIGMHSLLNEVGSYMEDGQVRIIALHGMGGVGKTTLMTEVNNKLCNSTKSFDAVFWIVISSTPSLSKIQNKIGSVLGFQSDEWQNKSQEDKADDIFNILKQKKYVLFLDDVWQRLDLQKLGVPRPDQTNKSKIVLTTRSKKVCGYMEAHKNIEVTCLKEEEAWNLFREKVGDNTINSHPEIQELAKVVAKECGGLPLALIVIGRAMASTKSPRAWNAAKDQLKKRSADFEAGLNGIDNEFFRSMTNLRVLDLSGNDFLKEIPDEVCNLVTLEYLKLPSTYTSKFPTNFHKLINLKWLSFPATIQHAPFPEELLSSFKKLQVLDITATTCALPLNFVVEIESLEHLKDLRIKIFGDDELSKFSSSHKLRSITKELYVNCTSSRNLNFLFSQKMVKLKLLECVELEYVISREIHGTSKMIDNNYLQGLEVLSIVKCGKLKNITMLAFASNPETIYVQICFGIKELFGEWEWEQEVGRRTPFPKLNYLGLFNLPELERIHPNAPLFPCLKGMHIQECPKLKKLPFNSNTCNLRTGFTIEGQEEWWKELEWEDEATRPTFLPSYKPLPQYY